MLVSEGMTPVVVSVAPETSVREVAQLLTTHALVGVPVIDHTGKLLGIVTQADLIVRDATVHLPRYIQILDSFIYFDNPKKTEEELRRALGVTAKDVMSSPVVTVAEETSVEDAATIMVDKRVNPVPVMKAGRVVGMLSRSDLVALIARDLGV